MATTPHTPSSSSNQHNQTQSNACSTITTVTGQAEEEVAGGEKRKQASKDAIEKTTD